MVHWYKRDPDAALAGMIGLTMEERGAYNTVIDLLYARNGDVPNDDRYMARAQQCNPQMWRRVRDSLITKGKIWVTTDGKLGANRVETTLKEAEKFSQSQSLKAKKRWKSTNGPMPRGNASTTTTTTIKNLSSFGTPSEREPIEPVPLEAVQPSRYLIESEISRRPIPPGLLATALLDGALARPAAAAAELPSNPNGEDDGQRGPGLEAIAPVVETEFRNCPAEREFLRDHSGQPGVCRLDEILPRKSRPDSAVYAAGPAISQTRNTAKPVAWVGGNAERPFTRAEVGKLSGWDWEK